jgi:hypothetical protein
MYRVALLAVMRRMFFTHADPQFMSIGLGRPSSARYARCYF